MSDFTINSDEIIKASARAIGVLGIGESLPASELEDGREALNMLVKQLMGPPTFLMRGFKPWQRELAELTLQAKIQYEIKTTGGDLDITPPISILSARLKDSDDNETLLDVMNRDQYDAIGNKTDENTPTAFYYERRLDTGYFYLDCVPSDLTEYTIDITWLDQLSAFTDVSSSMDFSQEWFRVLKFALAVDLAPEYGADPMKFKGLRDEAIAIASSFNTDDTFYSFQPEVD